MTIVWGGTLVLLLAKLKRKPYEVTRIKHDVKTRIKRLGVYYMCINDLPLYPPFTIKQRERVKSYKNSEKIIKGSQLYTVVYS